MQYDHTEKSTILLHLYKQEQDSLESVARHQFFSSVDEYVEHLIRKASRDYFIPGGKKLGFNFDMLLSRKSNDDFQTAFATPEWAGEPSQLELSLQSGLIWALQEVCGNLCIYAGDLLVKLNENEKDELRAIESEPDKNRLEKLRLEEDSRETLESKYIGCRSGETRGR